MLHRWFSRPTHDESLAKRSQMRFPADTGEYANFVVSSIGGTDPATRAMVVVAIENLRPLLSATEGACQKLGKQYSFDDVLERMYRGLGEVGQDDPINSRRYTWFVLGMHVIRLDEIAARNDALVEVALNVWLQLAESARYIPKLLESNIVWKPDEKEWFSLLKTENDGRRYALTMSMPSAYRRHVRARAFATDHNFLLLS